MPKQKGFLFQGGKEQEMVKFSLRMNIPTEEKEEFDRYCEVTGGKPAEIARFALRRIVKFDKYFQKVKDSPSKK